jgi:hypothetical protein
MRNAFSTKWTKHITAEKDRDQFRKTILASRTALDRLHDILMDELKALDNQETSITDYSDASWSHKQAHRNGERAFAKIVLDLLTFSKD